MDIIDEHAPQRSLNYDVNKAIWMELLQDVPQSMQPVEIGGRLMNQNQHTDNNIQNESLYWCLSHRRFIQLDLLNNFGYESRDQDATYIYCMLKSPHKQREREIESHERKPPLEEFLR